MNNRISFAGRQASLTWLLSACFLLIILLFGGGSASTVDSLVILRPLAALALVMGIWAIDRSSLLTFRWPLLLMGATVLLTAVHLIPLPPGWWASLPGRGAEARAATDAGVADVWRPLAAVPSAGWNALFSLLIPAATMAVLLCCSVHERRRMLELILVFGLVTCTFAMLQVILKDGSFYFFEVTNMGAAVGLFANRNHQAIFLACLPPILAVFAAAPGAGSESRLRRTWIAVGGALLIFPLLLVTGSRTGLLLALPALFFSLLLYETSLPKSREYRKRRKFRLLCYAAGVGAILAIAIVFIFFSRAEAFARLSASVAEGESNNRLPFWRLLPDMIWTYFPWGSGIGSFPEVFQLHEPVNLLKPTYLNHAHNDLLEVAMVAGLPGMLLIISALVAYLVGAFRLVRASDASAGDVVYGRLGAVILFLLGLASLGDYPLRVPTLAAVFSIAVIWTAQGCAHRAGHQANLSGKLD